MTDIPPRDHEKQAQQLVWAYDRLLELTRMELAKERPAKKPEWLRRARKWHKTQGWLDDRSEHP